MQSVGYMCILFIISKNDVRTLSKDKAKTINQEQFPRTRRNMKSSSGFRSHLQTKQCTGCRRVYKSNSGCGVFWINTHLFVMIRVCLVLFLQSSNMKLFTVRNEVAKVMFLQACVCPHGGGLPQCMLGYYGPPGSRHPPGADPPGPDTPHSGSRQPPPREQAHPPWKQTLPWSRPPQIWPLLRTVHILLECILVYFIFKLIVWATDTLVLDFWWRLPWVSKPGWIPTLRASLVVYNGFLRCTSGANLFVASMAAQTFHPHACTRVKHWRPGWAVLLPHSHLILWNL